VYINDLDGGPDVKMMAQKLRVPLGFILAAAVLYVAEPTRTSILLGLPVALVGALFRALAAGVIKKDSLIATSGVYSLTRNPLYFGSSLLACGFAIMSWNDSAATLLLFPFIVVYPTVILREEAHLERLFPKEFREYRSRVPRFFPRLTPGFHRSFSLDLYLYNREYNTVLGFAGALAVFALKYWLHPAN
jgi:protein-S-isoprenylcysteine O-methyltransferase Ste14